MNISIWSGFYVKAWVLTDFEDITAFSNLQKFASSFDQYGENIDDIDKIDDSEKLMMFTRSIIVTRPAFQT